jgi:Fungalysin metallopeptidase (M36)/PA domain/Fungalysin/Thermolysin Propeptide Motif
MLRKRFTVSALTIGLVALALTPVVMTGASAQSGPDPTAIALDHIRENADDLGVARADVTHLAVESSYASSHNRVTHVNVSQRFEGLEVLGAYATVNVADDGEVIFVGDSLADGLSADTSAAPSIAATDALEAAAEELELEEPEGLRVVDGPAGRAQKTVLSKAGVSSAPIPARLGWHAGKDGLRLAWQLVIDDAADAHLWDARVDANTGELLRVDDWTDRHSADELATTLARGASSAQGTALTSPDPVNDGSSYRVLELPLDSPLDGSRTLVTNPADAIGSPFGWHDTDGVAGPEFTITRGNNVHAYQDQDNNNGPDFGAPPFEARTGEVFVFSQSADVAYKRLTREIAVPQAGGTLTFWTNYTIEAAWDHLIVEARTAGDDDWTTLPDANGATTQATGESCPAGWRALHPHLDHYQTLAAGACTPSGTSGEWHGASGASGGWRQWSVDLADWTGETVEVSIAFVTDWATLEDGVAIDDVTLPDGTTTSFEAGLDGWAITGPPAGSAPNPNNWTRTDATSLPVSDTDGGPGLDFDFPADLNQHAQNYRDAATTNLYYWNNVIHDVMYRYGFDEPSGNFQASNYGRGGTGGDHVRAEAADGGGSNNANFSTPVETPTSGGTPRMQMYLWPGAQFGLPNQVVVDGLGPFDAQFARFSPAPTPAGLPGQRVVYAGTGCDAGLYPEPPASDWIAIVDGGTTACSYLRRVQVADTLGANGVIVAHNTAAAPPILASALIGAPVGIPAVSISQADGNAIKAAVAAGPTTANVRKHPNHPGIRDGDLDNGIIIHEYGHGISNRLTGGPTVNCLTGNEQAGEGWSDYFAITMLLDPAVDDPNQPRGMGPYALFQADRHGNGIRPRPYSRDMSIQPFTYDSIKTGGWLNNTSLALPHGLGHGWAAVLWDLNWDLIDKYGFNPDIYGDWNSGGNNRALQYVIDGLKMQGCGPGLVVASRAIIAAADQLSEGEDTCTVWSAFARRGLGFSAVQGTTGRNDNSEAYDTHPDCRRGFDAPVRRPYGELNEVDAGEAVPLRFTADGQTEADILTANSPFSRRVDCTTLQVPSQGAAVTPREFPINTLSQGGRGLTVTPSGRYSYNWRTLDEWAGTCREVVLTRDDGRQHRAFFQFQAD